MWSFDIVAYKTNEYRHCDGHFQPIRFMIPKDIMHVANEVVVGYSFWDGLLC